MAIKFLSQYHGFLKVGINLEGAVKGKKIDSIQLKKICKGIKKDKTDVQILILSSPKNYLLTQEIVNDLDLNYVATCYITKKILDVAAIIKHLDIIISPDTSIVHIASALNKPIVSIHEKNLDSFYLFAPTSSKNKTVFSSQKNSLQGFDVNKVVEFSNELIKELNK